MQFFELRVDHAVNGKWQMENLIKKPKETLWPSRSNGSFSAAWKGHVFAAPSAKTPSPLSRTT